MPEHNITLPSAALFSFLGFSPAIFANINADHPVYLQDPYLQDTQEESGAQQLTQGDFPEPITDVITVLAPKAAIQLSTQHHASANTHEAFTFGLNRTIADQLTQIVGVSLNGQGGQFQSYAIRGFSRGRIRTEIDGIPIITDRRAGNSVSFIAPSLISQGQVIKGPSAVLYGSQALGGVVNLTTDMQDETSLFLSGQSSGNAINATFKRQENGLTTAFAYQKGQNEQAANNEPLNTQYERASGVVKLRHQGKALTTTFSWLPSYGQDIGKSNVRFPEHATSDYPTEIHSLAQVQVSSSAGWLAKLFHHYQNWDNATERFDHYASLSQYQSHTLGGQWLQAFNHNTLNSVIGIDWLAREGVSISNEYDHVNNHLQGSENNVALYSTNTWHWGKAHVNLGLRYDWLQQSGHNAGLLADAALLVDAEHSLAAEYLKAKQSDANLSASLSFSFPINSALDIGLDIANGFRYPTLSERFFNGPTPRGLLQGNTDLKPEKSLGSQLSLNWLASHALKLHGAVYYYDLENYIERYRVNEELRTFRNRDDSKIYGIEAELEWQTSTKTTHFLSYQQQWGKNSQGERLNDLSPPTLSWKALVAFNTISFANAVNYYFNTDKVGPSETPRNSYAIWNASIDYLWSDDVSLRLAINNITDKNYYANLDEDAPLQPERNIRLSTKWLF